MYLFRIMSTENTSYKEKLSLILIKSYSWEKLYKHMQSQNKGGLNYCILVNNCATSMSMSFRRIYACMGIH